VASISSTLTAVGQTSQYLLLRNNEVCRLSVSRTGSGVWSADFVFAEGQAANKVTLIANFTSDQTDYEYRNQSGDTQYVAVQCRVIANGASLGVTIADVVGDQILEEWRAADGTLAFRIKDTGPSWPFGAGTVVPNPTDDRRYVQVGCVIRNSGAGWAFIADNNHKPTGFTSITVNGDGDIVLTYGFSARRVVALNVTVDETLGLAEIFVGPSVGLTTVVIKMYKPLRFWVNGSTVNADAFWGNTITASTADPNELVITHPAVFDANEPPVVTGVRGANRELPNIAVNAADDSIDIQAYQPLQGLVQWTGAAWQYLGEALTAPTFSYNSGTGELTVSHGNFEDLYGCLVAPRNATLTPVCTSTGSASFVVVFKDNTGAVVTGAESTNMQFFFQRAGLRQVPWNSSYRVAVSRGPAKLNANNVVSTGGNLWVLGLLEVDADEDIA
jgi:hypothetical protein